MNNTFSGRLNEEKIKKRRDLWKGKLVIKGGRICSRYGNYCSFGIGRRYHF